MSFHCMFPHLQRISLLCVALIVGIPVDVNLVGTTQFSIRLNMGNGCVGREALQMKSARSQCNTYKREIDRNAISIYRLIVIVGMLVGFLGIYYLDRQRQFAFVHFCTRGEHKQTLSAINYGIEMVWPVCV